jgi:RNA polymerase sigma factor (sigma-70 family)
VLKYKEAPSEELKELIWFAYRRLVIQIANRYERTGGFTSEELTGAGYEGFERALERFDVTQEFKFSTYLTTWVWNSISRHVQNHGRMIRVPLHVQRKQGFDEAYPDAGFIEDVAEGLFEPKVEPQEHNDEGETLAALLNQLPHRERQVLNSYYLEGVSWKEAGDRLGVSMTRSRQLGMQGIRRLRVLMMQHNLREAFE